MLCERCKQNQATTHIKTNINGVVEEHNLCSECAAMAGYAPTGFNLLDSFFGQSLAAPKHSNERRCECCGMSFSDIAKSGKVGCANCYTIFGDRLLPSLTRMHGKSHHSGKVPSSASPKAKAESELESLKSQLAAAIEAEQFEKAAELRDRIKDAQGGAQ